VYLFAAFQMHRRDAEDAEKSNQWVTIGVRIEHALRLGLLKGYGERFSLKTESARHSPMYHGFGGAMNGVSAFSAPLR